MMRPIIQQPSTTTTAVASNTSTATSSSIASDWPAPDTDGITFPSSSGYFTNPHNNSQIGIGIVNNNTNTTYSKLLSGKINQGTCNNNNNTSINNLHSINGHLNQKYPKIKTSKININNGKAANGNGNGHGNNNNTHHLERKNSLKTVKHFDKSSESLNKVEKKYFDSDCFDGNGDGSVDGVGDIVCDIIKDSNQTIEHDDDDTNGKLNTNLECAPLIELSPTKSITLVKQNSTSLIFTKKDVNPVVHRKRITLVRSNGTNSSTDKLSSTTELSDGTPIISHTNETISSPKKRHSFHWHSDRNGCVISTDKLKRKQIKSWYAVIGGDDEDSDDSSSNRFTCTTNSLPHGPIDGSELKNQPKLDQHRKNPPLYRQNNSNVQEMGHATTHTTIGSKYNRFEQLLKNLVGRKVSREPTSIASSLSTSAIIGSNGANLHSATATSLNHNANNRDSMQIVNHKYGPISTDRDHGCGGDEYDDRIHFGSSATFSRSGDDFTPENQHLNTPLLFPSPEIKIARAPSAHNLFRNEKSFTTTSSASTTSLNATMQQRLWSVVPLLRREGSCTSLNQSSTKPLIHQRYDGLKKCETISALTHSQTTSNFEPIKARNRLRQSQTIATCSRCSSILSLAATGSRYSLNIANGGFVPIPGDLEKSTSIRGDIGNIGNIDQPTVIKSPTSLSLSSAGGWVACKLCLNDVKYDKVFKLHQCGCQFCIDCMKAYVEFEILEGAYEISCPDALCPHQGVMDIEQDMKNLVSNDLIEKHKRFRLNREIELDKNRTWCPKAGCETVCLVEPRSKNNGNAGQSSSLISLAPVAVKCPTCIEEFCSNCKKTWHPMLTCEENTQRLAVNGGDDVVGIPFDTDLIKCCPMCGVPIEKDEGCAQMMCKRCKHVFCWYCLASLDDDFLLRHYDKGPCKNKLGHSRASVVWHRAQVIGIFASFGILLLVASPLLLLAAPCIVCCKCRLCSSKMEDVDGDFEDPNGPSQPPPSLTPPTTQQPQQQNR